MLCTQCGETVPEGIFVCQKCGAELIRENNEPVESSGVQGVDEPVLVQAPEKKPRSKTVIMAIGAAAVVFALVFVVTGVQKSNLQKALQEEWMDVEGSVLKILEFTEDEVEYRLETKISWLNSTVFTSDYKVISGKKIKINTFGEYRTHTIEFNSDKTRMTISPAFTSPDSYETWYNISY